MTSTLSTGIALNEKVCIITGASEGIGEAIASILAIDGGACVILASRQIDKLNLLAERLKAAGCSEQNILSIKCDVTKREDTQAVVQKTLEKFGRIDVLVNCAGLMYYTLMKNGQHDVSLNNNRSRFCSIVSNVCTFPPRFGPKTFYRLRLRSNRQAIVPLIVYLFEFGAETLFPPWSTPTPYLESSFGGSTNHLQRVRL